MSLFSPDSKFMQFMTRVGDLILLNFYFIITCLPIITIGDAITSLYDVCFRLGTEREPTSTSKAYFKAFKVNFKPATKVWLILLLLGAATAFNTLAFYYLNSWLRYFCILFGILFVLVLFMAAYAFPLTSLFENKTIPTLTNALIMSLGYLPRTILMVILNVLPFALLLCNVLTFFQAGLVWILIYFGAVAFCNAHLLRKVFEPYLEEAEDEEDEESEKEKQPSLKDGSQKETQALTDGSEGQPESDTEEQPVSAENHEEENS